MVLEKITIRIPIIIQEKNTVLGESLNSVNALWLLLLFLTLGTPFPRDPKIDLATIRSTDGHSK